MSHSVRLCKYSWNKVQIIKIVRTWTRLGLKECKELVERAPTIVKTDISKRQAEDLYLELFHAGATAEIVNDNPISRTRQQRKRLLSRT